MVREGNHKCHAGTHTRLGRRMDSENHGRFFFRETAAAAER